MQSVGVLMPVKGQYEPAVQDSCDDMPVVLQNLEASHAVGELEPDEGQ